MDLSVADVASVIAAVAAVFAAWYAFRGAQSARQSFALTARQDEVHNAGLSLYLVDGRVHRFRGEGFRLYELQLRITNNADVPSAIGQILFEIEFSRVRGPRSRITLKHENARPSDPHLGNPPFDLPLSCEPRAVSLGTTLFRIADVLLKDLRAEDYQVVVIDSQNRRASVRVIALNEQEYA